MNIVQLLEERSLRNVPTKLALENALEDAFLSGRANQFDNPVPSSVSSTIAIAMACNGHTFATTHGDHTVKVFDFASGTQIRNFRGHPRTPWTLKYHPLDPNIIASGCLGFQVRIWDIEEDACLNIIVFSQTIISLAFHPKGDFIAVACGTRIELWEWKVPNESAELLNKSHIDTRLILDGKYSRNYRPSESQLISRGISHTRNIRAVLFHPSGDFVLAVAPDTPKLNNDDLAHCRLFACEFKALFYLTGAPKWGEGVAKDKVNRISGANSYVLDRDDGEGGIISEDHYILPIKLNSCRVLIPQIHLYSDGGIDISKDGRFVLTCARVYVPPLYDDLIPSTNRKNLPPPPNALSPNSHRARVVADEQEIQRTRSSQHSQTHPSTEMPPLYVAMNMRREEGPGVESASSISSTQPKNYCDMMDEMCLEERHNIDGVPTVMNMTSKKASRPNIHIRDNSNHPSNTDSVSIVEKLISASFRGVSAYPRQKLVRVLEKQQYGYTQQDHLCLFEFHFVNGEIVPPTLVNSKNLSGPLTKAITSTKLSATCRHALIGYGVRVGGQVQDHARKHAACEIVDITDEQMTSLAVMIDFEDEVNIAQFHPFPGHGIVYGTKKGKVRTFCKS